MSSETANINSALLKWARETTATSPEEIARVLNLKDSKTQTATERYFDIENGDSPISWSRLKKIAHYYQKPITTFFMRKTPTEKDLLADFRTLGDHPVEADNWVKTLTTRFQAKQSELRDLLLDDNQPPLEWIGSFGVEAESDTIVDFLRGLLEFNFEQQKALNGTNALFAILREKTEKAGVFVQVATDLGSWHTKIEPELFRGFVLADEFAPMVVINGNDAKAARSFTLLHELVHLLFGQTAISNSNPFAESENERDIEQKCNRVAADFLLPAQEVVALWDRRIDDDLARTVEIISITTKVSRAFSARRLFELGIISEDSWWDLYNQYSREWAALKKVQKEQEGGPSYYTTTKHKIGDHTLRTVFSALDSGDVSDTRATRILGVNAHSFSKLREQLR